MPLDLGVRERPFTPFLEGVGERSERGVWTQCVGQVAHFNLTPEAPLYVDGLICYHSCCQVLQLNLTARILSNPSSTKNSGVGLNAERECGL